MLSSRRCGANTRAGSPCRSPAVAGKKRCRMHGGAAGSGAPLGNQNSYKHGRYSYAERERMRQLRELIRSISETLDALE
jgi:glucans biosynthesis protein